MDWTEEEIFQFLDLYKCEPHLWNPKHIMYKARGKVTESWKRISSKMGIPIDILKQKKNSLMATFRMLRRKKLMSLGAALGEDDTYQPTWFAYKTMENFLGDVYVQKKPKETSAAWSETSEDETQDVEDVDIAEETEVKPDISTIIFSDSAPKETPPGPKRPHSPIPVTTVELHYPPEKVSKLKTYSRYAQHGGTQDPAVDDECDLYAKLLAIKLRRYSTYERHCLMHEIDGLFLKKGPV